MLPPVRHFTPEEANAALEHVRPLVEQLVGEIAGHGAEVKDLDSGLIDFPALRNGETVLLCWQLGEDEIAFWHGTEDGFQGRRPLPIDMPFEGED